jgi:prepilin-type N-terminal cleavage/methylation domain-containing protein
MFRKNEKKKGFTLIELSIVLIIIGLLVAGIVAGSNLIDAAKLSKAQSLTKNSPVGAINGLVLWLESTLEDSYKKTEGLEEGTIVSYWKNYNKQIVGNHATQTSSGNEPSFEKNSETNLPAIRFNGSTDRFDIPSKVLNMPITIFFAGSFSSFVGTPYIIAKKFDSNVGSISLLADGDDVTGDGQITFTVSYDGNTSATIPAGQISVDEGVIVTARFDAGKTYDISLNGATPVPTAGASLTASAVVTNSLIEAKIGVFRNMTVTPAYAPGSEFNGDMFEIIIYNRVLSESEVDEVEGYLAKKWDISL